MKQFLVNVNGNKYEVTVEETGCIPASAAPAAPAPAAEYTPAIDAPKANAADFLTQGDDDQLPF